MIYKKLFIQLILRIVLICANALLLAYIFFLDKYVATQVNLLLLLIAQAVLLLYYLNKTNRELASFFASVTNLDSSIVFKQDEDNKSYSQLYKNLNQVNQVIEQARIEKIGQFEYLKQVVEHVGIGILSFDENLNIQFLNPAGLDILKINKVKNITDLDKVYPNLSKKLKNIQVNRQQLIHIKNEGIEMDLSMKAVDFVISGSRIKLLAFQDIQSELDKKEVESWQKIIRVLTHEIMNSVPPINSATTSISRLFKKDDTPIDPKEVDNDMIKKAIKGMEIIEQRSKGMLNFVQKFRDLTILPIPNKTKIEINDLFQTIDTLFRKEMDEKKINFKFTLGPSNLSINADRSQIEQILINLIKNASDALLNYNNPTISVNAELINNHIQIKVKDNGLGISTEVLDNIFIPFFTTKEKGSGIGLSLSRQIMLLHGGNISVQSEPEKGASFTLQF